MENKETINEDSFLGKVKAFAESMSEEVEKYRSDEDRHRALIVLAADAEDDESVKSYVGAHGDIGDTIVLLDRLISSCPLHCQDAIIDLLQSRCEQRKNKNYENKN